MSGILVVEDEAIIAQDLEHRLTELGYSVIGTAGSGEEAIEKAMALQPSLILMDVHLGGSTDGVEAARSIRQQLDVPVIYVTSFSDEKTVKRATGDGAYGYIVKPFTNTSLRTSIEITRQRHALEVRLREQERWHRTTLHSIGDAVIATGPDAHVVFLNEAAEQLTGWMSQEAKDRDIADVFTLVSDETEEPLPQPVRQALEDRAIALTKADAVLVSKDGGRLFIDDSAAPIIDDAGQLLGSVLVFRDISERVRMEQELKQLNAELAKHAREYQAINDELETRVAERTKEALDAQKQFHQAQKLETVGQLAGGIAHDFNNILAVILNYAEFALQELPEGTIKDDLQEIQNAAQRAADLIHQLLIFSRRDPTRTERVDINGQVSDTRSILSRTIGADIDLRTRLCDDAPAVNADPTHIEQVILNLAINARDAMPGGGILSIETSAVVVDEAYAKQHNDVQPGKFVCLSVSDSGHGMSKEVLDRAFEPFFTTKEKGTGTGLGLASVYGMVRRAGGHVLLYSEVGRGSTVKVYLPVAGAEERSRSEQNGEPDAPQGRGETILVVEDEPAVRELTCRILRAHGYSVLRAEDPASAHAVAAEHRGGIEMLLTDVVMPGSSGMELSKKLSETYPGLRHLYMSGYTEDIVRQQGPLDAPLISKPFTQAQLLEAVRAGLDDGGNGKEGP